MGQRERKRFDPRGRELGVGRWTGREGCGGDVEGVEEENGKTGILICLSQTARMPTTLRLSAQRVRALKRMDTVRENVLNPRRRRYQMARACTQPARRPPYCLAASNVDGKCPQLTQSWTVTLNSCSALKRWLRSIQNNARFYSISLAHAISFSKCFYRV